eukprot:m.22768 g.22768  ORF g.22768 m.22768 type:complete len:946 (-) comp8417_c0_seq1:151-2988(-)
MSGTVLPLAVAVLVLHLCLTVVVARKYVQPGLSVKDNPQLQKANYVPYVSLDSPAASAARPASGRWRHDNNIHYSIPPICQSANGPTSNASMIVSDNTNSTSQQMLFVNQTTFQFPSTSLCLGVSTEVDPDSGTPAIKIMQCNSTNPAQAFKYNQTSGQIIHIATGHCFDHDMGDDRVELYTCNSPVSPNQQWQVVSANTSIPNAVVIAPLADITSCMTACNTIEPGQVGNATSGTFNQATSQLLVETNTGATLNFTFYATDVLRVEMAPFGLFTNPPGSSIVENTSFDSTPGMSVQFAENSTAYTLTTATVIVTISKAPLLVAINNAQTGALLFQEIAPIQWNTSSTWQTLHTQTDEYFYGCGMQNGLFNHKGGQVQIAEGGGWKAGGRPNPVPYYASLSGYSVLRNTYSTGQYNFLFPTTSRHDEARLDAFYFFGDLPRTLDLYTQAAGRPIFPPVWGLFLGDSDCYTSHNRTTLDIVKVAQAYRSNDMPAGWMIPNDGYGCGYSDLVTTIKDLHGLGFYTALWTSTGLANATWEIGTAGSRGIKTDVGWVGAGYKFELDAVKLAAGLIQNNSDARPYTWSVCGWAGSHKYAVLWNGDNGGSWDYIDFQIPTVLGSSMSGQAHTSGDVDGIFAGSAETYVRDLQWKSFLTVSMTMNGWAKYDKQPWIRGEPYTTYSRNALKLKARLIPYFYTNSYIAHTTGMPPTRPLLLHYPSDKTTWDNTTQHQFMAGDFFLVAPIYNDTNMRDIYIPQDEFIDYWTGARYQGPQTIRNYPAPLDTIPVFVKAGAIIPMWPELNYYNETPHDPYTLDVYQAFTYTSVTTQYTLYEDDGITRKYEGGAFSQQNFTLVSSQSSVTLTLDAAVGTFDGIQTERAYIVTLHARLPVESVSLNKKTIPQCLTLAQCESSSDQGWYYSAGDRNGVAYIALGTLQQNKSYTLEVTEVP